MYNKRTSVHKHLMVALGIVHQSLQMLCFAHLFLTLVIRSKQPSCNAIRPMTMIFYIFGNAGLMFLYFGLYRHAEFHASGPSRLQAYHQNIKRQFLIPFITVGLRLGFEGMCKRYPLSVAQTGFMVLHLIIELAILQIYLQWWSKDIGEIFGDEEDSGFKGKKQTAKP